MDPNLHHTPLHWGYSSTPPQNAWVPPPQTRSLKRALSESDCDELYSEESSKDQTSPGDSDSCQLLSRKKRRGVIEKKRRDRINSSLSELKRLVPSAYEKQGSAKLEKAEILQLTVDHLKQLHAKGLDTMSYDPQRFAMDYHIIGFRECASEVARYLVTIEGMDIQDPLRLRLMSHLQYFVQQREISVKAGHSSPNWSSSSSYQPNYTPPTYQSYPTQTSSNTYVPNLPPPIQPYPSINPVSHNHGISVHNNIITPTTSTSTATETITTASLMSAVPPSQQTRSHHQQQVAGQQQSQSSQQEQQQQQHSQQQHYSNEHHHDHQGNRTYIDLTSATDHGNPSSSLGGGYTADGQYSSSASAAAQGYNTAGNVNYAGNGAKPYRPWGAEMAY